METSNYDGNTVPFHETGKSFLHEKKRKIIINLSRI